MKRKYIALTLAALLLAGCGGQSGKSNGKRGSSGKTLELMVVADKDVYTADVKSLIDSIFGSIQHCLPQPEKRFDIVHIPRSSFENVEMFRVHRNVLLLDVNPSNNNKVYHYSDKYATPQVIFDIAAKDRCSLDSLLRAYEPTIVNEMYEAEHKRVWKAYDTENDYGLENTAKETLGIGLKLSKNYGIGKLEKDFGWVRIEAKDLEYELESPKFPTLYKPSRRNDTEQMYYELKKKIADRLKENVR